jgi:hypothetical protein
VAFERVPASPDPADVVTWTALVRMLGHRFRVVRNAEGARNEEFERRWQCGCIARSGDVADGPQRYTSCRTHRAAAAALVAGT